MSRPSETIEGEIKVLEDELVFVNQIEQHNQLLILVHDELAECETVEQLRKFIRNSIIPQVYPVSTGDND